MGAVGTFVSVNDVALVDNLEYSSTYGKVVACFVHMDEFCQVVLPRHWYDVGRALLLFAP